MDELFDQRTTELTGFLCTRGYKREFVKQQMQRAKWLSREQLLTPATESTKRKSTRTPFVVTYHLGLPNIGGILRDLHPMRQLSEKCGKAIREIPMLAFWKPKSLKDYLVRAKGQKKRIKAEGSRSCGVGVSFFEVWFRGRQRILSSTCACVSFTQLVDNQ